MLFRSIRLSATQEGEAVAARAYVIGDALNEDLLSVLTPEERAILDRCLGKLMTWRPRGQGRGGDDRLSVEAEAVTG